MTEVKKENNKSKNFKKFLKEVMPILKSRKELVESLKFKNDIDVSILPVDNSNYIIKNRDKKKFLKMYSVLESLDNRKSSNMFSISGILNANNKPVRKEIFFN